MRNVNFWKLTLSSGVFHCCIAFSSQQWSTEQALHFVLKSTQSMSVVHEMYVQCLCIDFLYDWVEC